VLALSELPGDTLQKDTIPHPQADLIQRNKRHHSIFPCTDPLKYTTPLAEVECNLFWLAMISW
jgi:hypothetical protein